MPAVTVHPAPCLPVSAAHFTGNCPSAGRGPGQAIAHEAFGYNPALGQRLHALLAQGQTVPLVGGDGQGIPVF